MARVTEFQPTPNPNALKCVLDAAVSDRPRSFRSAADLGDPAAEPLAAALFALPGVAGLLICDNWVTVNKAPDAAWPALKPAISRVLKAHA